VEHCKPGSEVHFYDVIARNVVKIQFTPTGLRLAEGLLIDPRVFQRQVVRIIAVKETGDKGSWYKPVGTALGEITDEQRKDIVALTERFLPAAA
jgi:hypothetical protein